MALPSRALASPCRRTKISRPLAGLVSTLALVGCAQTPRVVETATPPVARGDSVAAPHFRR